MLLCTCLFLQIIWIFTFLVTLLFDLHWGLIAAFSVCIGVLIVRSTVAHSELVETTRPAIFSTETSKPRVDGLEQTQGNALSQNVVSHVFK